MDRVYNLGANLPEILYIKKKKKKETNRLHYFLNNPSLYHE